MLLWGGGGPFGMNPESQREQGNECPDRGAESQPSQHSACHSTLKSKAVKNNVMNTPSTNAMIAAEMTYQRCFRACLRLEGKDNQNTEGDRKSQENSIACEGTAGELARVPNPVILNPHSEYHEGDRNEEVCELDGHFHDVFLPSPCSQGVLGYQEDSR